MAKDQEESMIECLDAIGEINERLACSLRKCKELIDLLHYLDAMRQYGVMFSMGLIESWQRVKEPFKRSENG